MKKKIAKRGHTRVSKKIRNGDEVVAIAGNYKGQKGTVLKVDGERVVVKGINIAKKHMKPTQLNPQGSIAEIERPINISNIAPCLADGTPIKLKTKVLDNGDRQLVYNVGDKETVYRTLGKTKK